jgi:hypothetical protein
METASLPSSSGRHHTKGVLLLPPPARPSSVNTVAFLLRSFDSAAELGLWPRIRWAIAADSPEALGIERQNVPFLPTRRTADAGVDASHAKAERD